MDVSLTSLAMLRQLLFIKLYLHARHYNEYFIPNFSKNSAKHVVILSYSHLLQIRKLRLRKAALYY